MRAFLLIASALFAFAATMTFATSERQCGRVRPRCLPRRLRRTERGRRGPQAGGPLHQGAGERGLCETLRLTRVWPIGRGLAMFRD